VSPTHLALELLNVENTHNAKTIPIASIINLIKLIENHIIENATPEKNPFFICCGNITFMKYSIRSKNPMLIIFIFLYFANFLAEFCVYIYSGSLVAFADSDILKFIRLEIIMNAIQFANIRKGICLIKLDKNQNVLEIILSISQRAMIQSAFNAIYGPIIKLNTVIGTNIMKYNFSVDV
jgi:hypothetical protein